MMTEWGLIISRAASCSECATSRKSVTVRNWDEEIEWPDPLSYVDHLKVLLLSWSPPGGDKAIRERHFFYNARSRDLLRPKLFTALKRAGFDDLKVGTAQEQLDRFLRYGYYLLPVSLRRCSRDGKDEVPPLDLRIHSIRTHITEIVSYAGPEYIAILGSAPLETLVRAYPKKLPKKLIEIYMATGRVGDCRKFSNSLDREVTIRLNRGHLSKMIISNWPRGHGIDHLAEDIRRIRSGKAKILLPCSHD